MIYIYLDACVYITWIDQEKDDIPYLKGIEKIIRALDSTDNQHNPQYQLVTSTIILTEVLEGETRAKEYNKFLEIVQNAAVAVDLHIADLARIIRQKFGLKTPDAIHVATALSAQADYLYTNDDEILALENNADFAKFCKKYHKEHPGKQLKIIKPSLSEL